MKKNYTVSLGHEGATDSCLVLHNPNGKSKQYGVESVAWNIIGCFHNCNKKRNIVPLMLAKYIWRFFDEDIF